MWIYQINSEKGKKWLKIQELYRKATNLKKASLKIHKANLKALETDVIFVLPDNGRRVPGDEIPKGSYKITYG